MMRDFPRLVFTSPGKNECQGGTYGSELVQDEKEFEAAIGAGFFESIPEALAALTAPKEPVALKVAKTPKVAEEK